MATASTREVLVRVNVSQMLENDKSLRDGLDARTRLMEWGFRPFGQFWLGDEALLLRFKEGEIERVDAARPYGMFQGEVPPAKQ